MGLLSGFGLAFLGFLVTGVGGLSCPTGWMFYQGSCYGFFQDKMTWAEAEIEGQSQGGNGHLASIGSRAEGAVLARHIQAYQQECVNVWIGLRDPQRNRHWRWSDRSLVNFKAWLPGMPDNFNQLEEYCTELWCDAGYVGWNDVNCKAEWPYICKYEL